MLCLGYRDLYRAVIGFPGDIDEIWRRAVADRLVRIKLDKEKKYKLTSKPFVHAYDVKDKIIVLLVLKDKKAVEEKTIKNVITAARSLGNLAQRSSNGNSSITSATLADIIRTYSPKYVAPSRELVSMEDRNKKRTEDLQMEITEVTNIMRDSMDGLLKRQERLDDLESGTKEIEAGSFLLRKQAKQVEKKAWCTLCKTRCCLIVVVIILVLFVCGGVIFSVFQWVIPFIHNY